jgi:hypothetical protein
MRRVLWVCPIFPAPVTGTGRRELNLIQRLSREMQFVVVTGQDG